MSVDTFAPSLTPTVGTSEKPEFKILEADFGDGYTQASADGLNSVRRVVSLKWDYAPAVIAEAMRAFFDTKAGAVPFLYTIPGEADAVLWTCKEYDVAYPVAGYRSVTATFRQSFNIV